MKKIKEDFVASKPQKVVMAFSVRELDLLRMSVKGLYTHFSVHGNLFNSTLYDEVYAPILSQLNDLYWKIYKAM